MLLLSILYQLVRCLLGLTCGVPICARSRVTCGFAYSRLRDDR
jgi:hypothetical protein